MKKIKKLIEILTFQEQKKSDITFSYDIDYGFFRNAWFSLYCTIFSNII